MISGKCTVREIGDIAELADCKLLWNALLARTAGANFFQSLEWLTVFCRHYGRDMRLRVLLVSAGGETIGILPLVETTERTRLGPLRVLTYPLHDWGTFYGPLGDRPTATLLLGLRHIARTRRDWDLLELRWVPDGIDRGRTATALAGVEMPAQRSSWETAAVIDARQGWTAYLHSRDGRWRRKLRNNERRLLARGGIDYLRCRPAGTAAGDGDPRWDLYDACERIAERSWQARSPDGTTLSHPSVRPFLRDVHQAASAAGAADINLLYLAGEPAAFVYGYCCHGNVFTLRTGYNAAIEDGGPGSILLGRAIEDSCRRGDQSIDMGSGSLEYKRFWCTSIETTSRYTHYPPTVLRAQAIRWKRALQQRWQRAPFNFGSLESTTVPRADAESLAPARRSPSATDPDR